VITKTFNLSPDKQTYDQCSRAKRPEILDKPLKIIAWTPEDSAGAGLTKYVHALASLLKANLSLFVTQYPDRDVIKGLNNEAAQLHADLIIFKTLENTYPKSFRKTSLERKFVQQLETSTLIVKQPQWPIKNILLVIKNEICDETAINWAVRLAKTSHAAVTVLPIIIPIPEMYKQRAREHINVSSLLSSNSILGRKTLKTMRRFMEQDIEVDISLSNETPFWQAWYEIKNKSYEIILIAADPSNWLLRWAGGELAASVLEWADQPVLISKPFESQSNRNTWS
jgi:nucleotide-binding universal stress UspA family protein